MKKWLAALLLLCLLPVAALADGLALDGSGETITALPVDFSAGHVADPSLFTEESYADASITVQMEHIWDESGKVRFNVARVKIADASQLRTALAAPFGKTKTNKISTMAKDNNAIVAIGGDYYSDRSKGYIIRQGEVYLKTPFKTLDMLCIDDAGDFHIVPLSDATILKQVVENYTLVNVFNFGPALVIDGELQEISSSYQFNPGGKEPRCAIGQVGPLEYLLVVVDGRNAAGSEGCSMATLAQFMLDQGCVQAFNLDGGNSALMVFNGENYSQKSFSAERSVSDIIYFATAVDFGLDAEE